MRRLINSTIVPPGGFRFLVRETGTWVRGAHRGDLYTKVKKHCESNEIEPPTLAEIEDQICESLDGSVCMHDDGKPYQQSVVRPLTLREVLTASVTMGEWMLKGGNKVPQEEADRRALECTRCPKNKFFTDCTACNLNKVRNMAERFIGKAKTKYDGQLNNCEICGCTNKVQVWVPLEILQKHLTSKVNEALPDWCWKKIR